MRVIDELLIDDALGTAINIETRRRGIRGVVCHILRNDVGTLTLGDIFAGTVHTLMIGQPVEAELPRGALFGGPVSGEQLRLDWTTANLHRGFFRFIDEPIRPFGSCKLDGFEELAVTPATLSNNYSPTQPGAWTKLYRHIAAATQVGTLNTFFASAFDITVPLSRPSDAFTAGGQTLRLNAVAPFEGLTYTYLNQSAVNADFTMATYQEFG